MKLAAKIKANAILFIKVISNCALRTTNCELIIAPCAMITLCLFAACETDSYETGDGKYSYMRADFAEAHTTEVRKIDYCVNDEGDTVKFTSPVGVAWADKADTTYRTLVYYNAKPTGAEVLSVNYIPVYQLSIADTAKHIASAKTDPLTLSSAWLSRAGKYLNLGLDVKVSATTETTPKQSLGIKCESFTTNTDGSHDLYITLLHNQNGMPEYYSMRTYFSIPIKNVEADSLQVCFHTYDGEVAKTFSVR